MSVPLISDASEKNERDRGFQIAGMPWWAVAFLALIAAVSLIMAHYRLTSGDDLLELWGDNVSSIGQLLHIEKATPIEIDPFFYPGLMFSGIQLFGLNLFFLRLPSLLGFLVMEVCLFYFVRRIASENAGFFALAFPAITGAFAYTLQLRPYGVLLGMFGLAMLSWQTAIRRETRRIWLQVGLAIAIAIAINTHYYGVLLMLPLCTAELVRNWQRRRVDVPMLLSMGAGMAGIVFLLPFLKGAAEFRDHYQAGAISRHIVLESYNSVLLGRDIFSRDTNRLLGVALGVLMFLILWSCVRQSRGRMLKLPDAEFVFLVTLAALPVFGFLLGHYVTHAMEPRYALGAVIGISALLAIAMEPLFHVRWMGRVILIVLVAWFACKGIAGVRTERQARQQALSALVLSPQIKAAVMATPSKLLYTQDLDLYGFLVFHEPDAYMSQHIALVYSTAEEMRWNQAATSSRIAIHLKSVCALHPTPCTVLPYEGVIAQPGEHLFVVTHGGWNWTDKAFAEGKLDVAPVGPAFGSEVVAVLTR